MKQKLLYMIGILFILAGLSACGNWEPEVSRGDIATGSAATTGNAVTEQAEQRRKVTLELDISSKNQIVIPDPAESHGDVIHIQLQEENENDEEDKKVIEKRYRTDLSFAGFSDEVVVSSYAVGHMTGSDLEQSDCLALHVHENPGLRYTDEEERAKNYFLVLDYGNGTYYKTKTDFFLHDLSYWTKLECKDLTGDGKQELVVSHAYNKGIEIGVLRCQEQSHELVSLFSTLEDAEENEDYPDRSLFSGHLEDDYKVVLEFKDIEYSKTISMIRDGGYREKDLQLRTAEDPYGESRFVALWEDGKLQEKGSVFLDTLDAVDFVTDQSGVPQLELMRGICVGHRSEGVGYMHMFLQYDRKSDTMVLKRAEYASDKEEERWKYTDEVIDW